MVRLAMPLYLICNHDFYCVLHSHENDTCGVTLLKNMPDDSGN